MEFTKLDAQGNDKYQIIDLDKNENWKPPKYDFVLEALGVYHGSLFIPGSIIRDGWSKDRIGRVIASAQRYAITDTGMRYYAYCRNATPQEREWHLKVEAEIGEEIRETLFGVSVRKKPYWMSYIEASIFLSRGEDLDKWSRRGLEGININPLVQAG